MSATGLAARVEELVGSGRAREAAALCSGEGEHALASRILEEACDFAGAAREALLSGDAQRAAVCAALGGDDSIYESACDALVASGDAAARAALDLASRGFHRQAGALFERLGEHLEAASAFAASGDACRAAEAFERANRPADAARALEAALRTRPNDGLVRVRLAELLARHGRTATAVKTLQQLDPKAPERAGSLPLLSRCLAELGLEDAARSVREEMARLGIDANAKAPAIASEPVALQPEQGKLGTRDSGAPTEGAKTLFGRYEIVREVATTPHARVFEAWDRVTAERVAVKVFAGNFDGSGRDALLRFEREAQALAQLRHPSVVPLRDYLPRGPAIVLAWMSGGSLSDLMRREPLAPARAVEIACTVLGALGEAHRLGILHRDVKPSNVLFDEVGAARLSDFGAAHLGDLSSTATAGAIGTFAYMSPEQRLGRPATIASDVYGAGAMLYELLTGAGPTPPTGGRLVPAPSSCHPDLTESHDGAVARLLDEDPLRRPADAFQALRLLQSMAWSQRLPPGGLAARAAIRSSDRPPPTSGRVRLLASHEPNDSSIGQRLHDAWLERDVLVLPLDDESLERARAFARAGHPALPTVLRVDLSAREIRIAPPRGRRLAEEPRALSPGQLARLKEAIDLLHAAGGAHGSIDSEHMYWHDGEITLAYPKGPGPGDKGRDTEALEKLAPP